MAERKWTVFVDDNFHYGEAGSGHILGVFDSYDAALAACRKIIDDFLTTSDAPSAEKLLSQFQSFGESPSLFATPEDHSRPRFSAWSYAQARCVELRPEA